MASSLAPNWPFNQGDQLWHDRLNDIVAQTVIPCLSTTRPDLAALVNAGIDPDGLEIFERDTRLYWRAVVAGASRTWEPSRRRVTDRTLAGDGTVTNPDGWDADFSLSSLPDDEPTIGERFISYHVGAPDTDYPEGRPFAKSVPTPKLFNLATAARFAAPGSSTIPATDRIVLIDTSTGNETIGLGTPTADDWQDVWIKKGTTTNSLTITPADGFIDGQASLVIGPGAGIGGSTPVVHLAFAQGTWSVI
jgi:hypothetical protein